MASTRTRKQSAAPTLLAVDDLRGRVERLRHEVEEAVGTLGKRAVGVLPVEQQEQVDGVLGRLSSVRGEMNRTVDSWRSDIERRFKVIQGTVDKRVSTIRKETQSRSKKLSSSIEKDVRKYVVQIFKRLQLPVRTDIDLVKRRLTAIERRISELEKSDKRAA